MPKSLRIRLERVEKRVFKIFGSADLQFPSLFSFGDKMCFKIFSQVLSDGSHPLRQFIRENNFVSVRNFCPFRKPFCKTKRFSDSFIRYCR